jgi:hypothetical protein
MLQNEMKSVQICIEKYLRINNEMMIIGRKDKADFPLFDMENVPVKIDSGAYSSSIHCTMIEEKEHLNEPFLEVVFLDDSYPDFTMNKVCIKEYRKKTVKSSTGEAQERYFVQIPIILFGNEYLTDFSLTKRNGLKHPVLIGRKLLNKKFLIDTSKTNLSFKAKKKELK